MAKYKNRQTNESIEGYTKVDKVLEILTILTILYSFYIRPLSKPGKGIRFLEFVSLPPPRPSPTGEGAVLRQIQITVAVSHTDGYETIAIFAANESPPPVGEG